MNPHEGLGCGAESLFWRSAGFWRVLEEMIGIRERLLGSAKRQDRLPGTQPRRGAGYWDRGVRALCRDTVRSETSKPSSRNSPGILGAPQEVLTRAMLRGHQAGVLSSPSSGE